MLWHILKYLMGFTVAVFYKRLQVHNVKSIRVKGPVIIAMNHPNAFMDPIAFTTRVYPPKVMYLARGDVFKPGLISRLLESIGIVPIFRVQDGGKEGLKKNDATYRRVNYLLDHNNKIIIFAEGLCVQERRLRPLKKGVPRMVFGAMKEISHPELCVVPVGVNYSNPKNFRSDVFFNIGEPIYVRDYMKDYEAAPAKTMNRFLQDLEPRMRELIVHINDPADDVLVENMEELYKRESCRKQHLNYRNLEHSHRITGQIIDTINRVSEEHAAKKTELKKDTTRFLKELHKGGLRVWLLETYHQKQLNYLVLSLRILILLLGLPIYIMGLIGNYIPYKLSDAIPNKMVREVEFSASFKLGVGSLLFPLYYLAVFFITYAFSPHIGWPLLVILLSILSGWFCLYYSPFRKKTRGIFHALRLKSSRPEAWKQLRQEREMLISRFEQLA
ncbi:MAG: 1-acyl-sn-glycerol-3-phosphate acyltransferase [Bacteroidetes bacterium]|nr:1-acyl-sn-glycerol-3-phosphate acyltransferase [Bacteroidota bacterium]